MDGNGRWAQQHGLERMEGHKAGVETVRTVIKCCLEKKIPCLSLFAFSSENWQRPSEEVHFLMSLFITALRSEIDELVQQGIRLCFTGDREPLSILLQEQMAEAEQLTVDNKQLIVNIAVNYGGKWDIVSAAKKMTQAVIDNQIDLADVNEELFNQYIATTQLPELDLFIRTSGELRISNFFLWQLAYTELYFTEVHWPDFSAAEFESALAAFSKRKRRYGQVVSIS